MRGLIVFGVLVAALMFGLSSMLDTALSDASVKTHPALLVD